MGDVQISEIGQIAVMVDDLDRAVGFYREKLGMRFLFQVPGMAFFDCGGVRLMLGVGEGEEREAGTSTIYYKVDDLEATYNELTSRDVQFVEKPHLVARMEDHELWMAFFHDSEGNLLALMNERRG